MTNQNILSPWVKRFLSEYLITEKNLSRNTQQSYRDTFKLCFPFIAKNSKKEIDKLAFEDISSELIKKFLLNLELSRGCSVTTRNQRLAALHAFAKFISLNCPEYIDWCRQISSIPFKKAKSSSITYLEKYEMDALLNSPDLSTEQGRRDHAILLFLYNTGARANEIAQLTIADLEISSNLKKHFSIVNIRGKGNKLRRCPLWDQTVKELRILVSGREKNEPVFLNRRHYPITRFGIHNLVKRYVIKLHHKIPSLAKKQVSPHTIRHTTATHLLRAGVDINTIRVWLGHVSINTTNIYAEVDLEMKAKALACCEVINKKSKHWRNDKELMKFLNSL
jgi:integrase/recombinase XerD